MFLFWDGNFKELGSNYIGKRSEMYKHMQKICKIFIQLREKKINQ